jgi:hypothetical protein
MPAALRPTDTADQPSDPPISIVPVARAPASPTATIDCGSGSRAPETTARKMNRIPQSGRSPITSDVAIAAPPTSHGTRCCQPMRSHGPISALP